MKHFKSIILFLFLSTISLNAGLINAIALIVNNTPITLIDIDNTMKNEKLSKPKAVDKLVDEILYEQSIQKEKISVDMFELSDYIEKLAKQNNMKLHEFKNAVRLQESFESFENKVRKQMISQKLIASISSDKIIKATNEDMKIYYETNKANFKRISKIDLKVYISKNKKALEKIVRNPMRMVSSVKAQNITLKDEQLNPKIRYIISKTNEKTFSSIFVNRKEYNLFYIIKKYDEKIIKFDNAKNKIFETIMKKRQADFLKNYFETLRITADIKVLR